MRLCDEQGEEFARALINYTAAEVERIKASGSSVAVVWGSSVGQCGAVPVCQWGGAGSSSEQSTPTVAFRRVPQPLPLLT